MSRKNTKKPASIVIDPRTLAWEAEVYGNDPTGGNPSENF